ncbi:putative transposase [Thermus phage phiLo]|nr:putative transposase [Thermus phage phiLo]
MSQIPHTKAERIRTSLQATRERRKGQQAKVYQLKLQNLSEKQVADLDRAFLESKWLYNWLLEDTERRLEEDVGKVKEVPVKVGETFETRKLHLLGSQIKQEIRDRLKDSLRSLAQLKKRGHKVGRLRFKPFVNSIPLKQYGITYKVDFERNRVRIQKLGSFRVLGLHQIPTGAELASAVLVRRPSGYYLHLVAYVPKDEGSKGGDKEGVGELPPVGLDLGVKHQLTLSNGLRFEYGIPPSRRVRRLHRQLSRKEKGSKNYAHIRHLLRREYEKLNNRKRDIQNKLLAFLRRYPKVVLQDDQVKGWQEGLFGKKVHATAIGGLKGRLKASLPTLVALGPYETTSRECFRCGARLDLTLQDRYIRCTCGWEADRDHNAALVILRKGLGIPSEDALGLDRPEVTPLEMRAAVRIVGSNPYVRISSVVEGGSPPL